MNSDKFIYYVRGLSSTVYQFYENLLMIGKNSQTVMIALNRHLFFNVNLRKNTLY